ncbi:hypothetical protein AAZX31_13G223400 [Glycine max]|nr:putative nuclear RNA export factor SDE5 isoform X2 [Glycine max]XP_006594599.1 putative nuclear RNA export factor SDE5 isoform X2 [Glycine max]XP_028187210.1 putative nuclear RNA export factor SDE5 isoform X2 [Glycine soja]XP_028187211.1 putative nuclear RNA export factor SDE5 isoform X2 [Glycine soja]KAG4977877.1 hypothetical protein JHK86_037351 [Glycine max]KAH1103113.1 hypothetical protein GYH30_037210 [Glycine max]KHN08532.1 hypothetical protein glysoja_014297 [Glycine soja]KRH21457.|eukprot:XP_003543051.1 putative nuclear RNA export factor SDE5 isoform X2 [Glycine max]
MEVSGQNIVKCDEEKALKCLLDAFGSVFSLEEIASAYCKASRNADLAGEMLYEMKGSSSGSSTTLDSSNADVMTEGSSESSDAYSLENSFQERKTSRPKGRPISMGTVSSVIGKDYGRPARSANGSFASVKPTKLDAKSLPMTGIWREKGKADVSISKHDQLHQDMEDFLFKMLGEGFQLDRNMIRQVLDTCGYDIQKSLRKLLDRSNMASGKRTAVVGDSAGRFTDMKPKSEAPSTQRKSQDLNYTRGDGNIASTKEAEFQQKQKHNLQKAVLSTLFNYQGHSEEAPKRTVKDFNKKSRYGHVVFEPPKDFPEEFDFDMDFSRQENIDDPEDEEEYKNVRRAVKEYRGTMNEYYKAAVDSFAKGDQMKAEKLLEQGQFFLRKAHDADEESNKMILETRNTEAQEMVLDLRDHGSKEAIRLLKCHLSSLSGIPSFEYLKVIVDANDKDNTKGSRRRLRVFKLLEQESITWVEGETADTILIRLASIERKRLSFVKT